MVLLFTFSTTTGSSAFCAFTSETTGLGELKLGADEEHDEDDELEYEKTEEDGTYVDIDPPSKHFLCTMDGPVS